MLRKTLERNWEKDEGKHKRVREMEKAGGWHEWCQMEFIGFPCLHFRIARIRKESRRDHERSAWGAFPPYEARQEMF